MKVDLHTGQADYIIAAIIRMSTAKIQYSCQTHHNPDYRSLWRGQETVTYENREETRKFIQENQKT